MILKDQKEKITCTMDDVRGNILEPPHGTTPAAVIANKNFGHRIICHYMCCLNYSYKNVSKTSSFPGKIGICLYTG